MCEDSNGYLVSANNTLKQNVKTWLLKHKMLHDFISIEDGYVINLGVYYRARADATRNVVDIKVEASNLLIKQFAQKKNFGEPFLLKDIYEPLKATKGILDVVGALEITQRRGSLGDKTYSNINFDPSQHYSDDGLYIECPKNAIFEIKYLNLDGDIQGEIT
jgi:hypothetical protein